MARLNISLLGTFQVTLKRQSITHFRSSNNQGLLAYVLLQNDKPLPRELLAALFWPEESEKNARNNLRQSLYQLRKLLGDLDESAQPYLLVTRQTVQFNPMSDYALGVGQFLQAIDAGDLETAVSLYHGDLLPGFTCDSLEFESWLRQERETLHQLALEAMAEVTRDCLRNGRYDKAQTTARQQLTLEPWREPAYRHLMQAYALAGDRANALNQFELCQAALRDELGIEPAQETVTLFEDIKTGRFAPAASAETIRPPIKVKHNLPAATTPLIGRELEIVQLSEWLTQDKKRMVTIVAPGGMGKTRLGTAVGSALLAKYTDGVYFVDLAPLEHPDEIGSAIAAALDYQAPDKTQALFPQLLSTLSQRQMLLILDNFEHLLDGALLVNDMLQACPHLSILVTSRQRLNLVSENRFELGGLEFPDWLTPEDAVKYTAVQLFVENGRRSQPDFALSDSNVTDVVRICQLVQGMPLGLLLAATWLELLTPAEIAVEIENSLDFLTSELADLPPRQRSMQAVFDYSWQMMIASEQAVLAKLSVFRGGFTREAAEAVAGANLRVLLALVNKSLLQRQEDNGRFAMHELLRQFAAQHRRQIDANHETLRAHCRYFARVIKANVEPVDLLREWITQHYSDRDNVYRAYEFVLEDGLAEELLFLLTVVHNFNSHQGLPSSSMLMDAIQAMRQHGYAETDPLILRLRVWSIGVGWGLNDAHEMMTQLKNFIPALQKTGYTDLLKDVYQAIGFALDELGDIESAAYFKKAHETALKIGNEIRVKDAEASRLFNQIKFGLQDETAVAQLEELRAYFGPKYANSELYYQVLLNLARAKRAEKVYEQALDYGRRCLAMSQRWQELWIIGQSSGELAQTYAMMGQLDRAKQQHLSALEWHLAMGQTWQTLGQIYSQAVNIPEWLGGQVTAVSLLSMVAHHNEVVAYHQQLIAEALPAIKAEMDEAAFAAAWEEGKVMGFDTAVSLVRLALSGA